MICPRCGTVAAGQSTSCARCGGKLGHPASAVATTEPPVPRAPTHRGELAQRAAGIVPQVLARPKAPPAPPTATAPDAAPPTGVSGPTQPAPPHPPAGYPTPTAPPMPTPAAPPASGPAAWPPPPASWEPAGATGWAPPPAPASPPTQAPRWAPSPPSNWARTAATWKQRMAGPVVAGANPPSYLWQSLACLFLFLPSAVVALVYSTQVNRRVQVGDMTGAVRASRLARTWCFVTLLFFSVLMVWTIATGGLP